VKSVVVKQAHRFTCNAVKTIAMFIVDFFKKFDVDSQNVIMEKVVGLELLDIVVPPYLYDVNRLKHN
jgi:hypothetical protein